MKTFFHQRHRNSLFFTLTERERETDRQTDREIEGIGGSEKVFFADM